MMPPMVQRGPCGDAEVVTTSQWADFTVAT